MSGSWAASPTFSGVDGFGNCLRPGIIGAFGLTNQSRGSFVSIVDGPIHTQKLVRYFEGLWS